MKFVLVFIVFSVAAAPAFAQDPVTYHLSFPEPEHHWMQVDVTFPQAGSGVVQLRMSRSSPGRYALHEFAKNVYDVRITDSHGRAVTIERPDAHEWDVTGHDGTVRVSYKVYGDRLDGTYLAVDTSHAHINMPAALMWARGFDMRPARVTFQAPSNGRWRVATQLKPTNAADTFEAPNLQYLMDSPAEFSVHSERTFTTSVGSSGATAMFRIALHHDGSDVEAEGFVRDVETIVREEGAIFGEFPAYDVGYYTFLADFLPYASGDGMEHRNSTVMTSQDALRLPNQRQNNLSTVAHEFFHCWNVERIRPRALEPFNFEEANISGELWLAEGFTSYYDALVMHRAGLSDLAQTLVSLGASVDTVLNSPARASRTAEEMSRMAPFADGAHSIDRTNFQNTFISYYTYGAALGLGLDLTLRDRTNGRVTLDDYMRRLWTTFGKAGGKEPGFVIRPYTIADARVQLGELVGDPRFADEFFSRYIQGHDAVDYSRLLGRAGILVRRQAKGRSSLGDVRFDFTASGARLNTPAPFGSPVYKAGLDQDDVLVSLDGQAIASSETLDQFLRTHVAGTEVQVMFSRRGEHGTATTMVTLIEDPRVEIVAAEATGQRLTDQQKEFRQAWLGSKVR